MILDQSTDAFLVLPAIDVVVAQAEAHDSRVLLNTGNNVFKTSTQVVHAEVYNRVVRGKRDYA